MLDAVSDEGKAEEEQKEVKPLLTLSPFIFPCNLHSRWQYFLISFLQAELAVSELSGNGAGIVAAANTIISTFALVFVAEWGDKSFFSTIGETKTSNFHDKLGENKNLRSKTLKMYIMFYNFEALAAASSPLGVIAGALAGHGAATLVSSFSFDIKWLNFLYVNTLKILAIRLIKSISKQYY